MAKSAEQQKQGNALIRVKALLNNEEFNRFLDGYESDEDLDPTNEASVAELEKRFEAFRIKSEVAKEMKALYKGQIKTELEINLSDNELSEIDTYIDSVARTNPEQLKKLQNDFSEFRGATARIGTKEAAWDADTEKHGGLKALESKKDLLDAAQGRGIGDSLWGRIKRGGRDSVEQQSAKESVRRAHGIKDISSELDKISGAIDKAKQLEQLKQLRDQLLINFDGARDLYQRVRASAQEKFKQLRDSADTLPALERAHAQLVRMEQAGKKFGLDYTRGMKFEVEVADDESTEIATLDAKGIKADMELRIEAEVAKTIKEAVDRRSTVSDVEKSIRQELNRERIGSKQREQMKSFVKDTLAAHLQNTTSKSKRWFITTILASLELEA